MHRQKMYSSQRKTIRLSVYMVTLSCSSDYQNVNTTNIHVADNSSSLNRFGSVLSNGGVCMWHFYYSDRTVNLIESSPCKHS